MPTTIPTLPNYGAAAMLPDSLKVRQITSYPTRPMSGKYNMQAFDMAGVPANYVAPPPPPPPSTPNTPNIPNIPNINLGGLFGGLGGINWQALLQQYGGLLNQNKAPTPAVPTTPTASTQAMNPADLQGLLARIRSGKGFM